VKKSLVALLVAMLAGCATVGDHPAVKDPAAAWRQRQAQLLPLKDWRIQGRVSAHTPDDGWQASLRWVRNDQRHEIDLWGPLGRGHVRLSQDSSGAELRDAADNSYRAKDGEQLLFDQTGWWLPLDGLNFWVLGVPVPTAPDAHTLDQWGRLKRLQQLGWDIDFLQYRRQGNYDLPSKLFIRRKAGDSARSVTQSADGPPLEVRLAIERWTIAP
jgi:outer membrane lipoprotein LolB